MMADLVVFGAGDPCDIEEYFEAGANRYFIMLSGDFKRALQALREAGRLHENTRVGVAQIEYVEGPTLVESLPSDWRVSCVMSEFFRPQGECDVLALPAGWDDPGDLAKMNVLTVRDRIACHVYSTVGGDMAPDIEGQYSGLRELVRESNEHPDWEELNETDLRDLVNLGSVSIGGNLSPNDFPWLASVVPNAGTGLFWICDDAITHLQGLHPMYITHPKKQILEMLKLARKAGFGA